MSLSGLICAPERGAPRGERAVEMMLFAPLVSTRSVVLKVWRASTLLVDKI
jgi:hypothetical protein